jgi:hypothetical protein
MVFFTGCGDKLGQLRLKFSACVICITNAIRRQIINFTLHLITFPGEN